MMKINEKKKQKREKDENGDDEMKFSARAYTRIYVGSSTGMSYVLNDAVDVATAAAAVADFAKR